MCVPVKTCKHVQTAGASCTMIAKCFPFKTLLANERNCAIDQDAPQKRSVSGGNEIKGPDPTMIRTPAQASWSIVEAIPCGRPVRFRFKILTNQPIFLYSIIVEKI